MNKYLKILAGTIGTLTIILTAAFAIESHYAKQVDFIAFKQQYKIDRTESKLTVIQERIWSIEDRIDQLKEEGKDTKELERQLKELYNERDSEKLRLENLLKE